MRFWQLTLNGELAMHTAATLWRVFAGFVIGAVPAVAIGLLMAMFRPVRIFFDPLIAALMPIPKVALMPLLLLAFGFGDASKIALVATAVFFPVIVNTYAGAANIDRIYWDVAKNYGASSYILFTRVVFFGALPLIFAGLRIALAVSFVVLVAAEFVASKTGIGYLIWNSWELLAGRLHVRRHPRDRHSRPDHVGRVPGDRAQAHSVEGGVASPCGAPRQFRNTPQSCSSACSLCFNSALTGSAPRRIALAWKKSRVRKRADLGLQQQVGCLALELLGDDRTGHHQHGGVHRLDRIGDAGAVEVGRPGNLHRQDDVGAAAQEVERQRIGGAAVDQHAVVDHHRPHDRGQRDGRRQGRPERPRGVDDLAPSIEVGGDDAERNAERAELGRYGIGQELLAQLLRIEPHRRGKIPAEKVADLAGACEHQPPPHLAGIVGEAEHMVAQRLAGHAGGIGGAGQRPDRGSRDGDRA